MRKTMMKKKSYLNCEVVMNYKGKRIQGGVVGVDRNLHPIEKDPSTAGTRLLIQTEWKGSFLRGTETICEKSEYKSIYLDQAEGFRVIERADRYTGKDEPCDAVRDYRRVNN